MRTTESFRVTFRLLALVSTHALLLVLLLGWGPTSAQTARGICCWKPEPQSSQSDFTGKVIAVKKRDRTVLIGDHNGVRPLVLDRDASKEQAQLLEQLTVGDHVKGTFMKNRGMFHLDRQ